MEQKLIFTSEPARELDTLISGYAPSGLFLLADTNTARLVVPQLMEHSPALAVAQVIEITAGDDHKSLDALAHVWHRLSDSGATRHSLLVNVGGGMVTDLGGFAAATFKRGIRFINLPTTLLGAVDAAVGGKTGINFAGLKNEVGVFAKACAVVISTRYFGTLPHSELLSGYAEMLKHALIESPQALSQALDYDLGSADPGQLLPLLERSVRVKERIVTEDPFERGIRRALNLGHTVGHAFESMAMASGTPVPHGHAVAWGLAVDLILSHMHLGFDSTILRQVAQFVSDNYPAPSLKCSDYGTLIELMRHDKKNVDAATINFTLLRAPGDVCIDCTASPDEISAALDIFRDLMHI